MHLILYSKPGCHLCEGLQDKLLSIQTFSIDLEICDITTRDDWFQAYQYEIPVLMLVQSPSPRPDGEIAAPSSTNPDGPMLLPLPRPSPRASVRQLEQMLQKYRQLDPPQ